MTASARCANAQMSPKEHPAASRSRHCYVCIAWRLHPVNLDICNVQHRTNVASEMPHLHTSSTAGTLPFSTSSIALFTNFHWTYTQHTKSSSVWMHIMALQGTAVVLTMEQGWAWLCSCH